MNMMKHKDSFAYYNRGVIQLLANAPAWRGEFYYLKRVLFKFWIGLIGVKPFVGYGIYLSKHYDLGRDTGYVLLCLILPFALVFSFGYAFRLIHAWISG
jgi:hypothetical protein